MQTETLMLGAALVAEAVVIGGTLTGLARLRARVDRVALLAGGASDDARAAVTQAIVLAEEVGLLGEALAAKFAPGTALNDGPARIVTHTQERQDELAERDVMSVEQGDATETHAPAMVSAALPADAVGAGATRTDAAAATWPVAIVDADVRVAREKGMDPIGVALQRGLAENPYGVLR